MKGLAFIIGILSVLIACDYEPIGEHFVVIPQPDSTGMSVELTETTDTLFIYGNAEIICKSIIQNKQVRYFQAFLDGQSIVTRR
ncbi:MAG: hypothetical protein WKF87_01885 [Chryseolinea sp.]